jgi:hypothetical protein
MAFSYTFATQTIVDLDIRPGSYSKEADPEDVGGDDEPVIRTALDIKHKFDVFVEPTGNTTGLVLADLLQMAASKLHWHVGVTDTTVGTAGALPVSIIESVNIGGGAAKIATLVFAPTT